MKAAAVVPLLLASCSPGGGSGALASCPHPGSADPGPADDHCATAGPDGGPLVTTVDPALCTVAPSDDGGAACPYLRDRYGYEGDDDDCKYHVVWSSTPICEEPGNVLFTLKATYKVDGGPVVGGAPSPEVFTTTPGDWDAAGYCDDMSMTGGTGGPFVEGPPGTYVGPIGFTTSGQWTVRFHFFPNCAHWVNSPHGHVSFHVAVP